MRKNRTQKTSLPLPVPRPARLHTIHTRPPLSPPPSSTLLKPSIPRPPSTRLFSTTTLQRDRRGCMLDMAIHTPILPQSILLPRPIPRLVMTPTVSNVSLTHRLSIPPIAASRGLALDERSMSLCLRLGKNPWMRKSPSSTDHLRLRLAIRVLTVEMGPSSTCSSLSVFPLFSLVLLCYLPFPFYRFHFLPISSSKQLSDLVHRKLCPLVSISQRLHSNRHPNAHQHGINRNQYHSPRNITLPTSSLSSPPLPLSYGYTTRPFASAHTQTIHIYLPVSIHAKHQPKVIGTAVDHRFALFILTDALHLYSRCSMGRVEHCCFCRLLFFDEGGFLNVCCPSSYPLSLSDPSSLLSISFFLVFCYLLRLVALLSDSETLSSMDI